jgi:hypothetical protein
MAVCSSFFTMASESISKRLSFFTLYLALYLVFDNKISPYGVSCSNSSFIFHTSNNTDSFHFPSPHTLHCGSHSSYPSSLLLYFQSPPTCRRKEFVIPLPVPPLPGAAPSPIPRAASPALLLVSRALAPTLGDARPCPCSLLPVSSAAWPPAGWRMEWHNKEVRVRSPEATGELSGSSPTAWRRGDDCERDCKLSRQQDFH